MSTVEIKYRLPVTTITVSGRRTYARNEIVGPDETVVRESAISIEIVADPSGERTLMVPAPVKGKISTKVSVAQDGRLTGVKTNVEDQSNEHIKAALQVGFLSAGAVAPFVAPLGLIGAGIAATVGTAAAALAASASTAVRAFDRPTGEGEAEDHGDEAPQIEVPKAEELGIHRKYGAEHPAKAEVLRGLLWSEMVLQQQLAWPPLDRDAKTLRDLSRSLATIRAELARAQGQYSAWVDTKTTVIRVDSFRRAFTLDQLPDTRTLRESAENGLLSSDGPWAALFEDLRCAVSCDLDPLQDPRGADVAGDAPRLAYRRQQLATITTWRVEKSSSGKYQLVSEKVERKVVVLRSSEASIALGHGRDDVAIGAEFDSDGLLTTVEVERADSSIKRAQTIASIPAVAKDAFGTGKTLTQPWTTADRAAEVKARVELLESERKLTQLTGPAKPADPLLKQLEDVELQARIAAAQAIVDDPTRSFYLLRDVGSA